MLARLASSVPEHDFDYGFEYKWDGYRAITYVERAVRKFVADGVEAVAVCFLFSYLNPDHEDRARAILAQHMPQAFITTSSSVAPQFREFERFTTAALSAFIGPKIGSYISHLEGALDEAGLAADLLIMASNGGVATPAMAVRPTMRLPRTVVRGAELPIAHRAGPTTDRRSEGLDRTRLRIRPAPRPVDEEEGRTWQKLIRPNAAPRRRRRTPAIGT